MGRYFSIFNQLSIVAKLTGKVKEKSLLLFNVLILEVGREWISQISHMSLSILHWNATYVGCHRAREQKIN